MQPWEATESHAERLFGAASAGDADALDELWLIAQHKPDLVWDRLRAWGKPAPREDEYSDLLYQFSLVALADPRARAREVVFQAKARTSYSAGHPVVEVARRTIIEAADPQVINEACLNAEYDWLHLNGFGGYRSPGEGYPILELCLEHGLVPAEPVRRAGYLVLTGQREAYQALDPDGSLLAAWYTGEEEHRRSYLRVVVAATGVTDSLALLSLDQRPHAERSGHELEFLADELARRGQWDELAKICLDLPVAGLREHLTRAVRRFRPTDQWLPDSRRFQPLFRALRSFDLPRRDLPGLRDVPHEDQPTKPRWERPMGWRFMYQGSVLLQRQESDLPAIDALGLVIGGGHQPVGRVLRCALSPDGRRLAVVVDRGRLWIETYALPSGRALDRCEISGKVPFVALHRGLVVAERSGSPSRTVLKVHQDGGPARLGEVDGEVRAMRAHPDGFVALAKSRSGHPLLHIHRNDGTRLRTVSLNEIVAGLQARPKRPRDLVVDWQTGNIALLGGTVHLLDRAASRLLGSLPPDSRPAGAALLGRDLVVATTARRQHRLEHWRLDGDRLVSQAARDFPTLALDGDLVGLPRLGAIVAGTGTTRLSNLDHFCPAGAGKCPCQTVIVIPDVDSFEYQTGAPVTTVSVWASPDGASYVLAEPRYVEVVRPYSHALTKLMRQPLAKSTPDDLATVRAHLHRYGDGDLEWPGFGLLHAALVTRFGTGS